MVRGKDITLLINVPKIKTNIISLKFNELINIL